MTDPNTNPPRGILVGIGGNEDKEDDMVILRRITSELDGSAKRAVVIAAASREPVEASRPYLRAFEELGIEHVRPLDLQSRSEVEEDRTLRRLREADIIYFTGGDQTRLADVLHGSEALEIIRQRYRDGAVVAGTSAGAAAMSATMITSGKPEKGLEKGNTETSHAGLALLPGTVIDTHFIQRGRFSRLLEVIARHTDLLGLGLSEDTAFILREGRYIEVEGSDNLIIIDGREIKHSDAHVAKEGESLTVDRAIVHALAEGDRFDLQERLVAPVRRTKPKVSA